MALAAEFTFTNAVAAAEGVRQAAKAAAFATWGYQTGVSVTLEGFCDRLRWQFGSNAFDVVQVFQALSIEADGNVSALVLELALERMVADGEWRNWFFNGDAQARREHDAVAKMLATPEGRIDAALSGKSQIPEMETVAEGDLSSAKLASAVADLRNSGLTDVGIKELLIGDAKITPEQVKLAEHLREMKMADAEWRSRLLAGDAAARKELALISAVLVAAEFANPRKVERWRRLRFPNPDPPFAPCRCAGRDVSTRCS